FFQAEDGIRDPLVTGVQTCALPIFPGFKVSTAAYVNSLFRPEIVRDLKLREYGFESLERNPSSFSPFPDGRYLLMGPDDQLNHRSEERRVGKECRSRSAPGRAKRQR